MSRAERGRTLGRAGRGGFAAILLPTLAAAVGEAPPPPAAEIIRVANAGAGDVAVTWQPLPGATLPETVHVVVRSARGTAVGPPLEVGVPDGPSEVLVPGAAAVVDQLGVRYQAAIEDGNGQPLSEPSAYVLMPVDGSSPCRYEIPDGLRGDVVVLSEALDGLLDDLAYCRLEDALTTLLGWGSGELDCEIQGLLGHLADGVDPLPIDPCTDDCDYFWQAVVQRSPALRDVTLLNPAGHPEGQPGFTEAVEEQEHAAHCVAAQAVGDPGSAGLHLHDATVSGDVRLELDLRRRLGPETCHPACAALAMFELEHHGSLGGEAEAVGDAGYAATHLAERAVFAIDGQTVLDSAIDSRFDTALAITDADAQGFSRTATIPARPAPTEATLALTGDYRVEAQGDAWAFGELLDGYRIEAAGEALCLAEPQASLRLAGSYLIRDREGSGTKLRRWSRR